MDHWRKFKTCKRRGEVVELQFMAQAAIRGFSVSKPWGETNPYDIGVEHGTHFLRVQVKSTTVRAGSGYYCQFSPSSRLKKDYTLEQLDLFAAFVIPVQVWYLIPAAALLGPQRTVGVTLFPLNRLKKDRCKFEQYREAWHLLTKTRRDLARRSPLG